MPYKDSNSEAAKAYRERHRQQKNAYMSRYRLANLEAERERARKWHETNKEHAAEYQRKYAKAHPEANRAAKKRLRLKPEVRARESEYSKKWRGNNRERSNANVRNWAKRKRETDANFAILTRIRNRLGKMVLSRGIRKAAKTWELVGCKPDFLRGYLEARFQPGMTWENRSKWHIDHHIPCAEFDLRDPVQQRQCFHYSNLRPLWSAHNLAKGAKPPGVHQAELL